MKNTLLITCPRCDYRINGRLWRCPGCGGYDDNNPQAREDQGITAGILEQDHCCLEYANRNMLREKNKTLPPGPKPVTTQAKAFR